MATLNENVAKVKENFRNIKETVNNFYVEYDEEPIIMSNTPTSMYGEIIGTQFAEHLTEMGYQNGREEGVEIGKQEILDNSKYIPKTAVGKLISLTDVSEVAHKVKVYGDNCEVDVYGKNLIDYTRAFVRDTSSSLVIDETTNSIIYDGNYYFKIPMKLPSGQTVTVSGEGVAYFVFEYEDGSLGNANGVITKTTEKTTRNIYLYKYNATVSETGYVFRNIQVELGSNTTPYEPYKGQTITATPLGTEIDSMCPNMNFFADGELDILVEYFSSFGMQTEYDRFWDGYQNHGNRREYGNAFAGAGWSDATFKPKYDIVVTAGSNLFLGSKITDIVKRLDECGVALDTSKCTALSYAMQGMSSKTFPLLDLSAITSAPTNFFNNCSNLEYIVGIVCSEKTNFNNTSFGSCPKLTHCIFSGVIASDINLQWSPLLDEESLQSLTQSLADFIMVDNNPTGTNIPEGQPFTKTLTLSPESWAILDNLEFIPPEGTGYPTGFSCTTVITTAKGWNKA